MPAEAQPGVEGLDGSPPSIVFAPFDTEGGGFETPPFSALLAFPSDVKSAALVFPPPSESFATIVHPPFSALLVCRSDVKSAVLVFPPPSE